MRLIAVSCKCNVYLVEFPVEITFDKIIGDIRRIIERGFRCRNLPAFAYIDSAVSQHCLTVRTGSYNDRFLRRPYLLHRQVDNVYVISSAEAFVG